LAFSSLFLAPNLITCFLDEGAHLLLRHTASPKFFSYRGEDCGERFAPLIPSALLSESIFEDIESYSFDALPGLGSPLQKLLFDFWWKL